MSEIQELIDLAKSSGDLWWAHGTAAEAELQAVRDVYLRAGMSNAQVLDKLLEISSILGLAPAASPPAASDCTCPHAGASYEVIDPYCPLHGTAAARKAMQAEAQEPLIFRFQKDVGGCGYGCYFPTTNMCVNDRGSRGIGKPSNDVEWIPAAPSPAGGTLAEAIRSHKNPYNGPTTAGAYNRGLLDAAALVASQPPPPAEGGGAIPVDDVALKLYLPPCDVPPEPKRGEWKLPASPPSENCPDERGWATGPVRCPPSPPAEASK